MPSVDSFSGLFVFIMYLVLTVSLNCLTFINGLYNRGVQHVLDYMSNIEEGLYETGIAYPSRAPGFTLGFLWNLCP
jgi:hypothetical protein